ncbi:winged-helix domain-containing protein [Burkholderia pyrrocinia]|uniref:winged-helix domain-containing protein n=1 Tax=Burkholderia pyrrocinia TaxID=60550 RepID=UPI001BCF6530|nr:winged-helix domain-containing protein [Burkholderia pyrrocinia]QVN19281.1 hypothetical protein JYG32_06010 [Burkholderia pyrrocinia]
MKRNPALLLGILIALEDSPQEELSSIDLKDTLNETTQSNYSVSEVRYHAHLLGDRGLVESGNRGHRLTDSGHDHLEAARQKGRENL